ncbi:MAG: DinB family protein [Vicinamibacteria bacterium]
MAEALPPDLAELETALAAADREARAVVEGLDDARANWQPRGGAGWSVAQCLDHLAVANTTYVAAMAPAVARARGRGRMRRGPVAPGFFASLFIRELEPPVRRKMRNPRVIAPTSALPVAEALARFVRSQEAVRRLLSDAEDLDLAVRFANPYVSGLRFRLQAGFLIVLAHDRRHLWQARQVRADAAFPAR